MNGWPRARPGADKADKTDPPSPFSYHGQADPRPKRTVTQWVCKAAPKPQEEEKDGDDGDARLAEDMYRAFVQTVARQVWWFGVDE